MQTFPAHVDRDGAFSGRDGTATDAASRRPPRAHVDQLASRHRSLLDRRKSCAQDRGRFFCGVVMHRPITTIRWLAFAVLCLAVASMGWAIIEHQLTLWGRLVCPEGWWRSSPGVCAFPPVSISILAIGYGVVSALLLATTVLVAPSHKLEACTLLFVAIALWPVYTLLFKHFSWVALASLCAVIGIALCFSLGAFAMHDPSFKRDA